MSTENDQLGYRPHRPPPHGASAAPPPALDANQSLTFTPSDFTWSYAKGTPPPGLDPKLAALADGKYGYNSNDNPAVPQRDLLNGSYFNDAFIEGATSKVVTFHSPGDVATVNFGLGALVENAIIARPIGTPGAEDFSYQYDPAHPEELNVSVDVKVVGLLAPLHFTATPQVTAGADLMLIQTDPSSPYHDEVLALNRNDPMPDAPADLPGGFHDPNRFLVQFNSQDFMLNGNKYTATIEDMRFDAYKDLSVPTSTYPGNPHNPIDFEPAILTITLDKIG